MRSSSTPSIFAATLLVLTWLTWCSPAQADEAAASPSPSSSPSPSPATAAPTPIPLAKVPSEAESAFGELHQIEDGASQDRATLDSTTSGLSNLRMEIRAR